MSQVFHISNRRPYLHLLRITGWLGIFASLTVGVGEFLVHYAGDALHGGGGGFAFFHAVPSERLPLGHFLMVLGLPFYLVGYFHVFLALQPGSRPLAAAVWFLGASSFMIGGIWAGTRGLLGAMVQALPEVSGPAALEVFLASYGSMIEVLVQVLRVLVLANSTLIVFTILQRKTLYPRWIALFNPIALLIVVFLLFLYVPVVGDYLVPSAMNVAHFVMFSASLWALRTAHDDR